MITDNSRALEEKYTEGYSVRCTEIKESHLVVIENELYELTPRQLNKFRSIRRHTSGSNFDRWHKSLDYVRNTCTLINSHIETYNY